MRSKQNTTNNPKQVQKLQSNNITSGHTQPLKNQSMFKNQHNDQNQYAGKKQVTFNQPSKSQDNISSDRYSSKNSKQVQNTSSLQFGNTQGSQLDAVKSLNSQDMSTDNNVKSQVDWNQVNKNASKSGSVNKVNGQGNNEKNGETSLDSSMYKGHPEEKVSITSNDQQEESNYRGHHLEVNMDLNDFDLDQLETYNQLIEDPDEYQHEEEILNVKRLRRQAHMYKRYEKLVEQDRTHSQKKLSTQEIDEDITNQEESEQVIGDLDSVNAKPKQADFFAKLETFNEMPDSQDQLADTQRSQKSRKQVCISEEPGPRVVNEVAVNQASQMQSDGTFLSVSSMSEKMEFGLHNEKVSNNYAMDKQSDNSIISEEESAIEEATPAAKMREGRNKAQNYGFSSQTQEIQDQYAKKKKNSSSVQHRRDMLKKKKSTSMNEADGAIMPDNRKAKPVRTQTMGMAKAQAKHDLKNDSPTMKSKGKLTNVDQESNKFQSNKNQRAGKSSNVNQEKRESSGFTHIDKINLTNVNYKKQITQDDKRKKKNKQQEERDSRNNSLNLTVDNQLDQLSMNFGVNKYGYRNQDKQKSTERDSQQDKIIQGTFSVFSSHNKFDVNQKDYILARSKQKIDPHSNQRFKRQVSNDSRFDSSGNMRSPRRSYYKSGVDKSYKSGRSGHQDNSLSIGWHHSSAIRQDTEDDEEVTETMHKKANLINIYMKKPYKVMTIKQLRQRERDLSGSKIRLFQAENSLKVHTAFNRYNNQQQRMRQTEQKPRQVLIEQLHPVKPELTPHLVVQRSNDSSINQIQSRGKNDVDISEMSDDQNPHVIASSRMHPGSSHVRYLEHAALTPNHFASPTSHLIHYANGQYTFADNTMDSKSQFDLKIGDKSIKSNNLVLLNSNRDEKEDRRILEKQFKIRFYDQVLSQLDRQHDIISNQVSSLKKTQDICNIYGQTFSPIVFGDASYTSASQNVTQNSPRERIKSTKKPNHKNADILKPLGQQLRDKKEKANESNIVGGGRADSPVDTQQINHEIEKNNYKDNLKLSLPNLKDILMNEEIIAESARVKKDIVIYESEIKSKKHPVASPTCPLSPREEQAIKQRERNLQQIAPDSSRECDKSFDKGSKAEAKNVQDSWNFAPQVQYALSKLTSQEQLQALLQMSSEMGYSHQQLKLISHKHKLIQDAERSLERIVRKLSKKPRTNSEKKAQHTYKKQNTGKSLDFYQKDKTESQQRTYDEGGKDINLYYPKPQQQSPSKFKHYNIDKRPKRLPQDHLTMIQQNKQNYKDKINQLMTTNPRSKIYTGESGVRSNDSSLLKGSFMSRQQPLGNQIGEAKRSLDNEDSTVEDYFGNKIMLRRSIENMNYETKQFKRSMRVNHEVSEDITSEMLKNSTKLNIDEMGDGGKGIKTTKSRMYKPGTITTTKKAISAVTPTHQKAPRSKNISSEKPKFDYIKNNKKNLLPFTKTDLDRIPANNQSNVGSPSQLPEINVGNTIGQPDAMKKGNKTIPGVEKIKLAEINDDSRRQSQNQNYKGYAPSVEERSPIRKERSRIISDVKNSKSKLIQSGQHIVGKQQQVFPQATSGSASGKQLGYQFKNISPRLPGFNNNLQNLKQKSTDLQNQINKMQAPHKLDQVRQSFNNNNDILVTSSAYGSVGKQATKQTEILKGVLNQQRRLNRIIQNNGVIGTGNNSSMNTNAAIHQKYLANEMRKGHNISNFSNNTSMGSGMIVPHGRSLHGTDSYTHSRGMPVSQPRSNTQSVMNNPTNNPNTFTTLDPQQQTRQFNENSNQYIQNIHSGAGDLANNEEEIREQISQHMSTIQSMNAPAQ